MPSSVGWILAGKHPVGFEVFADRLFDDVGRDHAVVAGIGLVPVTGELLVKRRLRMSGLVACKRPEAAAVGRQHLVSQHDAAVLVDAELELGE